LTPWRSRSYASCFLNCAMFTTCGAAVPPLWLSACSARLCPVLRWRRRRQLFFVCAGPGRQMLASSAAAAAAAASGKAAAAAAAAASSTGKSLPVHACAFTIGQHFTYHASTPCSHSRQAVVYVCKLTGEQYVLVMQERMALPQLLLLQLQHLVALHLQLLPLLHLVTLR